MKDGIYNIVLENIISIQDINIFQTISTNLESIDITHVLFCAYEINIKRYCKINGK